MIYPKNPDIKEIEREEIQDSTKWGVLGAHDPSIFKDNDIFYVFSTDARVEGRALPAVQIRKSRDLINWQYVGRAIDDVPQEAKNWTMAEGVWAPEAIKVENQYYLYYCASSFGKNKSCIGLLKADSITGPWRDEGIVIKTDNGDDRNAIDPNLIFDIDGSLWMSYGSFWTGIYLVKLNKHTGKLDSEGDKGVRIAGRHHSTEGAIEGPYIIYNEQFKKYYLFVSYDSLASDYNIRVGRSDSISGPYMDINGVEMTDLNAENPNHVGNKIAGGYRFGNKEGWIAPGHNSVLNNNGEYFIVHHIRKEFNPSWFYMHVRRILWSEDGWPMVSPERYAGEIEQKKIEGVVLPGKWEFITLYRDVNRVMVSKEYELRVSGEILGEYTGEWHIVEDNIMVIKFEIRNEIEEYRGKVIPVWDWEKNKSSIAFTGIDSSGVALWGKRIK